MKALTLAVLLLISVPADAAWRHNVGFDYSIRVYYLTHPNGDRWYWTCTLNTQGLRCAFRKG